MKTKLIKNGKVEIFLMDSPAINGKTIRLNSVNDVEGNWQFLSTIKEVTEEQATKLVDGAPNGIQFPNYNHPYHILEFAFAKGSFRSLLESNEVQFENPHEMPNSRHYSPKQLENDNSKYWKLFEKYKQAQQNVFNPETTLIFVKHDTHL